ncbi:MAG: hypothetical protein KGM15_06580 [Pseudomonadota bacterium]|nr:hypothetical protein [Pseudomonadota bacterium]
MNRIRFTEAADVFAAYPLLEHFAARPTGPRAPLDYVRDLMAAPPPSAALAFLAHLLPRREAIWWGCQCVSAASPARAPGLQLAQRWVRGPDEALRREALAYSQASDLKAPDAWLARAVGYSGGSLLAPDQPATPPAPDACAQAVNAAAVLAAAAQPAPAVLPWIRAFAEAGIRFAQGGEARVDAPAKAQSPLSPQ